MKEFLDPTHEHPPFNFPLRPDLGGTRYEFVREISRDKIIFSLGDINGVSRLTIPGDKSFVHISVENSEGCVYSEAYYDFLGELTSANIWFRRYCDQNRFIAIADPDDNVMETYSQLVEKGTDIMLEADLIQENLGMYYCEDNSTADDLKLLTSADEGFPLEVPFINFSPGEEEGITPVQFYAALRENDEELLLGFTTNEKGLVHDTFSTVVNFDRLYHKPSPADVRRILESVFLKY